MKLLRWWPVALLLAVAGAVLPWVLFGHDLPDPVATHWELWGDADGHTSRAVIAVVIVGVTTVAAAAAALARRTEWAWILHGLTGLAAGISAVTVLVNRGADTWRQADMNLLWLVPLLAPMVLLALVGARLAEVAGPADHDDERGPALDLGPGEMATWTGTSEARWPVLLAGGLLVAAVVQGTTAVALVLVATAVLLVLLASVRVTVGANGVRARPGLVAWPAVALPLARIAHAEAIDARPIQWGGWGYRGSLRLMHRAAWVVRRGEGLRVDLTDHRVFVVTVDHADQAAEVLNALVARRT